VPLASIDGEESAARAVDEFDQNSDRSLGAEELKACPSLEAAIGAYDTDGNKALSEAEIAAGIGLWSKRAVGAIPLPFAVTLDGRPLPGAVVKLIPEPFVGDSLKPAGGQADETGGGMLNMAAEDRPANVPAQLAVVQPGLYRVEITHPTRKIPEKYNVKTTLGVESSAAGQTTSGVTWALKSR
jgi:hypothetical protein